MNKITVVGSLNMDLVVSASIQPKIGETIIGNNFKSTCGGKGANQAVSASKLGGNVNMIGRVGDDTFGNKFLDIFKKHNIDTSNIKVSPNSSTGVAVITVIMGDNSIILDSGANFKITKDDILNAADLIKSSKVLVLQLEIPFEAVIAAAEIAKENGVTVILNPAPARKLPEILYEMCDIIVPNETELETLTGIKPVDFESTASAIHILREKGINNVVITLGKKGCIFNNGDDIILKEAPKVNAIDTTAAGDSFIGALAVKLAEGKSIQDSINFCNSVGALTCTNEGGLSSLPTLSEVELFAPNKL